MRCLECDGSGLIWPRVPERIKDEVRRDPDGWAARDGGPEAEDCECCHGRGECNGECE